MPDGRPDVNVLETLDRDVLVAVYEGLVGYSPFEGDASMSVDEVRGILPECISDYPMFREDNTDGLRADDLVMLNEAALTLAPLVGSLDRACQIVTNNWLAGGNTLANLTRPPIVQG